jgi:hypothetical protein
LKDVLSHGKEGADAGGPFWEISKKETEQKIDYKKKIQQEHQRVDAVKNAIENTIEE